MNEKTPENLNVLDDVDFDFSAIVEKPIATDTTESASRTTIIPRIKPKQQMINFLTSVKMDEEFNFSFGGNLEAAKDYIHAMRVELSRLRGKARNLGKRNIVFRIVIVSIIPQQVFNGYIITIKRTQQPISAPAEIQADVLDALTAEEK